MQRQIDMIRTLESNIRQRSPFSGAESLFPTWKECLGQTRLSAELQGSYRRGIRAYSDFCRRHRLEVTVETARRFMAESAGPESLAAATVEVWKEALNWFFREARAHLAPVLHGLPTLGRVDLGRTDSLASHSECKSGVNLRISQ